MFGEQRQDDELESAFLHDNVSRERFNDDKDLQDDEDAFALQPSDEQHLLGTHHGNASTTSIFSFESIPMIALTQTQARGPELQKKLSLMNGLGLTIGSMIGSGLFSSPGSVLTSAGAAGTALAVWLISGLLALLGALCYAELGTMLPMNGGEAVYLQHAYGSLASFMFETINILVSKPGSLAIILVVFGEYLSRIAYHSYYFRMPHDSDAATQLAEAVIPAFLPKLIALSGLVILCLLNAFSTRVGVYVLDGLSVLKVLLAVVISVIGVVVLAQGSASASSFQGDLFSGIDTLSFGQCTLAFYSGLWAYDGWNNINYVSGEMTHPHRDLPRVIMFSIPTVIVCYLLANVAYLAVLPVEVVKHTNTVAMDFGQKMFGTVGGILFAACIAFSCFGTAHASIFTGSRIIYVSAKQGHMPAFFGKLSTMRQTPITAIVLQAALTTIYVVVGTFRGLVNFYSITAWIFYFLAVLALLILRFTEPALPRPYRVWLPTPILFCLVALFLCITPFIEAPYESLASLGLVILTIPVWLIRVRFRETFERLWTKCLGRSQTNRHGYTGVEMVES